jgi:rubredoxin
MNNLINTTADFKSYICLVCGHIYDELLGDPKSGIAPGTKWEDIPESWVCAECDANKLDFILLEF